MSLSDFRLKVFDAVASCGSFTKSAYRLGVSQSAVSQNIAELEKQLGVSLFHRNRGAVTLTQQGQAFAGYVRQILYWSDAADLLFSSGLPVSRNVVSISAVPDMASSVLPDVLSPLIAKGFRFDIKTSHSDIESTFGEHPDAEMEILPLLHGDGIPGTEWECVGKSPLCAVVLSSDTNAFGGVSSLSGIKENSLAVWTGGVRGGTDAAGMVGIDNVSRVAFCSGNADAVLNMVRVCRNLAAIVPLYSVRKKIADRSMTRLPIISPIGDVDVLVRPSSAFSSSPAYKVIRQRLSGLLL